MTKKRNKTTIIIICAILILIILAFFYVSIQKRGDKSSTINVYFSPNNGVMDRIVSEINNAKSSIDIAMYCFTKREIAQAIIKAKKRGVNIRIVLDKRSSSNKYSKFRFFKNNGINPKIMGKTMHNKFAVIDKKLLITGSYNWTANAERNNYENILFVRKSPNVIKAYLKEFEGLWRMGE
ncbi:MAG: phospholipase D family protein [Candidatus Eremiobacteraeota bacterium]|nr:phospholipase D family protein [Candidatus Eremiobacteraeota bacterium]